MKITRAITAGGAATLMLALSACGSDETNEEAETPVEEQTEVPEETPNEGEEPEATEDAEGTAEEDSEATGGEEAFDRITLEEREAVETAPYEIVRESTGFGDRTTVQIELDQDLDDREKAAQAEKTAAEGLEEAVSQEANTSFVVQVMDSATETEEPVAEASFNGEQAEELDFDDPELNVFAGIPHEQITLYARLA